MSLLQGVLRSNTEDLENGLRNIRLNNTKRRTSYEDKDKHTSNESDDDLVNVVSPLFALLSSYIFLSIAIGFSSWYSC